jgi:23S rRNA-/tRNA-specific pseudouridylate synthase
MAVVERGGKQAIMHYEVIGKTGGQRLLRLWPKTGRTHQLRVHLAHLGAPVVGDRLYGEWAEGERLMLHAAAITLPAMRGFAARTFEAPVPDMFAELLG